MIFIYEYISGNVIASRGNDKNGMEHGSSKGIIEVESEGKGELMMRRDAEGKNMNGANGKGVMDRRVDVVS